MARRSRRSRSTSRRSRNRSGQFTSRRSPSRRSRKSRRTSRIGPSTSLLRRLAKLNAGAPASASGDAQPMKLKGYSSVKLSLGRKGGKGSEFVACATMGSGTKKAAVECASGRNVRAAVAHALRKVAGKVESRSGTFAALNGTKSRRRRRSR